MFRRNAIGDRARFVQVARHDESATFGERRGDDVGAWHFAEESRNASLDALDHLTIGCQQNRLRHLVVLRLREQVERNPIRILRPIRDHENLRYARDHVDADRTENAALRGCDVRVARTANLVDGGDRCGPVRKCGDRLRAADREHARRLHEMRRGEQQRIARAIRRRDGDDDVTHAGDLRRNGIHQH